MKHGALKIAVIYVIAGVLWITLSDKLLLLMQNKLDLNVVLFISSIKGIGYVLLTGLLLYKLIRLHTRRLAESEEQYRTYFDYNIKPMWIVNRRSLFFLAINHAAIDKYGYSRDEFLKKSVLDIQIPEEINKFISLFRDLKAGINNMGEWKHIKQDGSMVNVSISAHVITGQNAENVMIMAEEIE